MKVLNVEVNNIPNELKQYDHWLLWNRVPLPDNPDKQTKRPVNLHGKPFEGWNDTNSLYSFETVANAYKTGKFSGIGFSQKNTPYVCVDLDNDIGIEDIPEELTSIMQEGYAEISPSGNGIHVWMQAELSEDVLKGIGKKRRTDAGDGIELFTKSGWLTVTGNKLNNNPIIDKKDYVIELAYKYNFLKKEQPKQVQDFNFTTNYNQNDYSPSPNNAVGNSFSEQELINKMLESRSGTAIQRLLNGDISGHNNDSSSADMALCGHLAFWTNKDAEKMDSIFRQSGLMREKWDRPTGDSTYGRITIDEAIQGTSEGYKGKRERVEPTQTNLNVIEQQAKMQVAKMNLDEMTFNDLTSEQLKVIEEDKRKELYLRTSAKSYVQRFINGIAASVDTPAIPTGFKDLDETLEGGLYEGLYFIGAISSLGKTTFVLQIADQIAQQGQDVLIFSLEMARTELMAKSISRLTLLETLEKDLPKSYAKTTRGITAGKRYAEYNQEEKELINNSIIEYNKYANHLYIHEGIGTIGADEVTKTVKQHIKYTGNTPVVIIDYLQILAPEDMRATDKQNTDRSVLQLKRLSRDFKLPVIGISSFNRDNYNNAVSMASFKESGAIEYSSDVLIGLQFSKQREVDEDNRNKRPNAPRSIVDADAEKDKNPRLLELKVLKNRNGATGGGIDYEYYPLFNHFVETGHVDKKSKEPAYKITF